MRSALRLDSSVHCLVDSSFLFLIDVCRLFSDSSTRRFQSLFELFIDSSTCCLIDTCRLFIDTRALRLEISFHRRIDAFHGVRSDVAVNLSLDWLENRIHRRVHDFDVVFVSRRGIRRGGRLGNYLGSGLGNQLGSWFGNHLRCWLGGNLEGRLGFLVLRVWRIWWGLGSIVVIRVRHRGTGEIVHHKPVVVIWRIWWGLRGIIVFHFHDRGRRALGRNLGRNKISPPHFGRGRSRIHQLRRRDVSRGAVGSPSINMCLVHGRASPSCRRGDTGQ